MKEFIVRVIDPEEIQWYEEEPEIPELIRCKDCKFYHNPEIGFTMGDCTRRTSWYSVLENEYCSLARRKDGDGE